MNIDAIPTGKKTPDDVNVVIEVSIGGEPIKYEMDKEAGVLFVDRFLHTPMRYPGNYGFVPHTLSEDGDPIDVLVANTRPIMPGAVIEAGAKVSYAIVGEGCRVGRNAVVGGAPGSVPFEDWGIAVLGPRTSVADGAVIEPKMMLGENGKEVRP